MLKMLKGLGIVFGLTLMLVAHNVFAQGAPESRAALDAMDTAAFDAAIVPFFVAHEAFLAGLNFDHATVCRAIAIDRMNAQNIPQATQDAALVEGDVWVAIGNVYRNAAVTAKTEGDAKVSLANPKRTHARLMHQYKVYSTAITEANAARDLFLEAKVKYELAEDKYPQAATEYELARDSFDNLYPYPGP